MRMGKSDIESSDGGYLIFLTKITWNLRLMRDLLGMEIVGVVWKLWAAKGLFFVMLTQLSMYCCISIYYLNIGRD